MCALTRARMGGVCVYVCVYVCACVKNHGVCVCVCVCVHVRVCVYMCVHACMCVCLSVHVILLMGLYWIEMQRWPHIQKQIAELKYL